MGAWAGAGEDPHHQGEAAEHRKHVRRAPQHRVPAEGGMPGRIDRHGPSVTVPPAAASSSGGCRRTAGADRSRRSADKPQATTIPPIMATEAYSSRWGGMVAWSRPGRCARRRPRRWRTGPPSRPPPPARGSGPAATRSLLCMPKGRWRVALPCLRVGGQPGSLRRAWSGSRLSHRPWRAGRPGSPGRPPTR